MPIVVVDVGGGHAGSKIAVNIVLLVAGTTDNGQEIARVALYEAESFFFRRAAWASAFDFSAALAAVSTCRSRSATGCFTSGVCTVSRKDVLERELAFGGLAAGWWGCERRGFRVMAVVAVVAGWIGKRGELDVRVKGFVRCFLSHVDLVRCAVWFLIRDTIGLRNGGQCVHAHT